MSDAGQSGRYTIAVLGKALDLLDALDGAHSPTLTELSVRTGIPKATALRILANLEARGYVDRDGNSRYRLGVRLLQLGARASDTLDLRTVARPELEALQREFDETVNLAVPAGDGIVYIDILQSAHGLRMTASAGMRDDYHSSALGKAMLAHWSPQELETLLSREPLPRKTERTLVTRQTLLDDLAMVRERGYAIDDEENQAGARCIGAPILNHVKKCVGAISLSGPANRITLDRIDEIATRVAATAATISRHIGHTSASPDGRLTKR